MTNRLDAVVAREYERNGETKTSFKNIGVAFETRNGGWQVLLEAMPAPVDGQFKILLMPPRDRDAAPRGGAPVNPGAALDDEIPFGPEVR